MTFKWKKKICMNEEKHLFGLLRTCWSVGCWCGLTGVRRWSRADRALAASMCAIQNRSRGNSWLYFSGSCNSMGVVATLTWAGHKYLSEERRTRQGTLNSRIWWSPVIVLCLPGMAGTGVLQTPHTWDEYMGYGSCSLTGGSKRNKMCHKKKSIRTAVLSSVKKVHGLLHYIVSLLLFPIFCSTACHHKVLPYAEPFYKNFEDKRTLNYGCFGYLFPSVSFSWVKISNWVG